MKSKQEILARMDVPEQRWSGLESENMKLFGCSLLVPRDVYYLAGSSTLKPQRTIQITRDKIVDFPGSQTVMLDASSRKYSQEESLRIMPLCLTIAGRVRFTDQCLSVFTVSMRSRSESHRLGLPANSLVEWPDVRALVLCPICASTQTTGKEYWMVFQQLQQIDMENLSNTMRQLPRLMCLDCFESVWASVGQGAGMRDEVVATNPGCPVAGFPVPGDIIMTALDNFDWWERTGNYAAVDLKARQSTVDFVNSKLKGPAKFAAMARKEFDRDPMLAWKKQGACLTCDKVGKTKCCSCCRYVWYCSVECQHADWKRHKKYCKKQK